jgi:hypothetical protein
MNQISVHNFNHLVLTNKISSHSYTPVLICVGICYICSFSGVSVSMIGVVTRLTVM